MMKSQSALEYIVTHIWTIMIIVVIMAALVGVGAFDQNIITPSATPGSCYVSRPNGVASTQFITLQGLCGGQLPQYTALFDGSSATGIAATLKGAPSISTSGGAVTITAWAYSEDTNNYRAFFQYDAVMPQLLLSYDDNCPAANVLSIMYLSGSYYNDYCLGPAITAGTWTFYAVTYDGKSSTAVTYEGVGGTLYAAAALSYPLFTNTIPANPVVYIGNSGLVLAWLGGVSNVQVYNATLSASEIKALYMEGIGGAPLVLQNLVGWWPLNGDANDYSGNAEAGVASDVSFTSKWMNGYTAP